jgi:C-terminal processing protease CtpA/Prc/tricorn protease-like protein
MKPVVLLLALLAFLPLLAEAPHFASDPAISPDGSTVCFAYLDDLWRVPFAGGIATRLTATDADEYSPLWSPDGAWIYYGSSKDGRGKIWRIPANGGTTEKVCDEELSPVDWFANGALLAAGSLSGSQTALYVLEGQRPREIAGMGDSYATILPGDQRIVFNRRGEPFREAYTGSTAGELWAIELANEQHTLSQDARYTRLTNTPFTERYPVASQVSGRVFFAASDGKVFQLYAAEHGDFAHPHQLTRFDDWSVRDISIARTTDRLVFERFDELWSWDNGKPAKLSIDIREDLTRETSVVAPIRDRASDFEPSPNGKFVVFACDYDLFTVPVAGGETIAITHDQPGIKDISILDDNRTVFFTAYDKGRAALYRFTIDKPSLVEAVDWAKGLEIEGIDAIAKKRLAVTWSKGEKRSRISLLDNSGTLIQDVIPDITTWSGFTVAGKTAFFVDTRPDIWVRTLTAVDLDSGKRTPMLSRRSWIGTPVVTHDQKALLFTSQGRVCRLDLIARSEFADEKNHWDDIVKPETKTVTPKKSSKKPATDELKIDFTGIDQRVRDIITLPGYTYIVGVGNDSLFYYINSYRDVTTLHSAKVNGGSDKVLYTFAGYPDGFVFCPAKKRAFWLENKSIKTFVEDKNPRTVHADILHQYDRQKLNQSMFYIVWNNFGRNFYDPKMHGHDWNAFLKRYLPFTEYADDTSTLSTIVDEMIGDVNASHTGFYPRQEPSRKPYRPAAELPLEFDYSARPNFGITIARTYRHSSLCDAYGVRDGDVVTAINDAPIGPDTAISPLLIDQTGQPLRLAIQRGDSTFTAVVRGLNWSEKRDLVYEDRVARRRETVDRLSHGRIGYQHIRSMDDASLQRFREDLFARNADKDAVIIDVRGNGGGRIHDDLIEDLTRKPYASTNGRDFASRLITQPANSWTKPLVLLIDEDCFSDSEIFPLLFHEMKIGKVIGTPTPGGVIGTIDVDLMDGSRMRLPRNGWFTLDGKNMEGLGAQPDILIVPTPEQILNNDDVQLKKAIDELLNELN